MLQRGSLLSRTLAILLLAAIPIGGYRFVVAPLISAYQETERSIEQSQELLERYRALAEERAGLAERLAEQEGQATATSGYLEGPSDALAAAQLQDRVKAVVETAEGELRSTQILPAKPVDNGRGVRRAALRVRLVIAIDGLAAALYELETGQPYLLIDELIVREQRTRRRPSDPEPQPMLDVSLEVAGYLYEKPA